MIKNDKTDVGNENKPSGGHGSHFQIALGDVELVQGVVLYAINEPDSKERMAVEVPAFGKSSLFVGNKKVNDFLCIIGMTVNGNIYTAYPKNIKTVKYSAMIKEVIDWKNGLEAWVNAEVSEAKLYFFATDYYKNKHRYAMEKKVEINISAFAYHVKNAEAKEIKTRDGKLLSTKGMCAIIPYSMISETSFEDDYWFQGEIMEVIRFGNNRVFRTKIAILKDKPFEIWIYVLSDFIRGKFEKGNFISGVLWLQGSL